MDKHLLGFSTTTTSTRLTADRPSAARGTSLQPKPTSQPVRENPMISPQELIRIAEQDFNSAEDVRSHAAQRVLEFDKEWGIQPDAEDDFSPMTR